MDTLCRGVLLLLKSGITGERYPLPEGFNLSEACVIMEQHNVLPLGYRGARLCGMDPHGSVMQKLYLAYRKSLQISEKQMAAVRKIYHALDEAGLDYMPVKGCNMKGLYPYPELRMMGDADILIRMEQYPRIREIMLALNFTEGPESNHELVWDSPELHLEFHKRLIPADNKDYFQYYGDGWKLASRSEGTHFYMKPEDEFIYIFTHMAKHYRYGGIGFRQLLDLWVLLRCYPELDMTYIGRELEKLRLHKFYENIRRTLAVWFEDREPDDVTELITEYIFQSGCWGSMQSHEISGAVESMDQAATTGGSRFQWILQNTFPSVERISVNYPIARKYPVLLPGIWVWRWIDVLLTRPGKIWDKYRSARKLTDENLTDFQKSLHAVGLDFRFDENE